MSNFIRKNILASYGKIPTEDLIEKGKKAAIGEIREWNGKKVQKQANGDWKEVSESKNKSDKKPEDKGVVLENMIKDIFNEVFPNAKNYEKQWGDGPKQFNSKNSKTISFEDSNGIGQFMEITRFAEEFSSDGKTSTVLYGLTVRKKDTYTPQIEVYAKDTGSTDIKSELSKKLKEKIQ